MAFFSIDPASSVAFNSDVGHQFLLKYQSHVDKEIREQNERVSSKTFAPSSFRCDRKSWFRLRGTEPDTNQPVDRSMAFMAMLGTACHQSIQSTLIRMAESDPDFEWISVPDYLAEHPLPGKYTVTQNGYESQIELIEPFPIKFACDGIVRWKGVYYLLEIKTAEHSSFVSLTGCKPHHADQVTLYATIFNIADVLMIYQDRQYGDLNVYTYKIKEYQRTDITRRLSNVMDHVASNIAPDPLPRGDLFCSGCNYAHKCAQWGR